MLYATHLRAIEYERRLEIYIFGLAFLKVTFLVVCWFVLDVGPRWLGAKQKRCFNYCLGNFGMYLLCK